MITINDNIKGLIFDLDGTLVDSMQAHYEAWNDMAKYAGFEFPKDYFYALAGMPTIKIIKILSEKHNIDLDPYELVKVKEEAYYTRLDRIKIIEPVVDVVKRYFEVLPMSIGTGGKRDISVRVVKELGLDKYFNIMVAAEDVENHKPAPDTFLKCAELMKVLPEHCQVFEDGELGIEAAKAAGMAVTDVRHYL